MSVLSYEPHHYHLQFTHILLPPWFVIRYYTYLNCMFIALDGTIYIAFLLQGTIRKNNVLRHAKKHNPSGTLLP